MLNQVPVTTTNPISIVRLPVVSPHQRCYRSSFERGWVRDPYLLFLMRLANYHGQIQFYLGRKDLAQVAPHILNLEPICRNGRIVFERLFTSGICSLPDATRVKESLLPSQRDRLRPTYDELGNALLKYQLNLDFQFCKGVP